MYKILTWVLGLMLFQCAASATERNHDLDSSALNNELSSLIANVTALEKSVLDRRKILLLASIDEAVLFIDQDTSTAPADVISLTTKKNHLLGIRSLIVPLNDDVLSWSIRHSILRDAPLSSEKIMPIIKWHSKLTIYSQQLPDALATGVTQLQNDLEEWLTTYSGKFFNMYNSSLEPLVIALVENGTAEGISGKASVLTYNLASMKLKKENRLAESSTISCKATYVIRKVARLNGVIDHPKELNAMPCIFIKTVSDYKHQGLFTLPSNKMLCHGNYPAFASNLASSPCISKILLFKD